MISIAKIVNVEVEPPNVACSTKYKKGELWKCLMVDYLFPFVNVDLMIIQSLYDSWVSVNILGINCVAKGISTCSK